MQQLIYEVFDEFKAAPTREQKIAVLRKNRTWALETVLRSFFDDHINFSIKDVPYKPSVVPPGMGYTNMTMELDRLYLFQPEHPKLSPNLSVERREVLLIQILEALEAREAEVFVNILHKDPKVPGLDAEIVREAFPGLI